MSFFVVDKKINGNVKRKNVKFEIRACKMEEIAPINGPNGPYTSVTRLCYIIRHTDAIIIFYARCLQFNVSLLTKVGLSNSVK